jgi:RimJ/RimL family protein N-acetyltransferase
MIIISDDGINITKISGAADMPTLKTSRLECSPIVEADWPFFLALQQNQQVMRFVAEIARRRRFVRRLQAASRLVTGQRTLALPGGARPRDRHAARRHGLHSPGNGLCGSGVPVCARSPGKGYGLESLHAVCQYAFAEGGIRRLVATVTAGNIASRRLLEKTGFVLEGELREAYWLDEALAKRLAVWFAGPAI